MDMAKGKPMYVVGGSAVLLEIIPKASLLGRNGIPIRPSCTTPGNLPAGFFI